MYASQCNIFIHCTRPSAGATARLIIHVFVTPSVEVTTKKINISGGGSPRNFALRREGRYNIISMAIYLGCLYATRVFMQYVLSTYVFEHLFRSSSFPYRPKIIRYTTTTWLTAHTHCMKYVCHESHLSDI